MYREQVCRILYCRVPNTLTSLAGITVRYRYGIITVIFYTVIQNYSRYIRSNFASVILADLDRI